MPKDTAATATLCVSVGQYSDAGQKPLNQDFCGAQIPHGSDLRLKGIALAVADGISSSAVSGEAAEIAVKSLLTDYYATPDAWAVRTASTRVIAATNAWLFSQNSAIADIDAGRVCTFSALILKGREGHILHVGDSRISRVSGGSLEPLTEDHRRTLTSGGSHLTRALGIDAAVEVDYRSIPLAKGNVFLLSTDGVHDHIGTEDLHRALAEPDLDTAARMLAQAALARGSDDNLTVQIVRIDALPPEDAGLSLLAADMPVPRLPNAGDMLDGFLLSARCMPRPEAMSSLPGIRRAQRSR
jgi:serine/threonine protein phosphatase PrpC